MAFSLDALTMRAVSGRTLVVGSKVYNDKLDRRLLYGDAVGVDMQDGPGVDVVHDLEQPIDIGLFDHVDCCSVLEHVRCPWLMAENIEHLMRPGASLLVSVPFVWRMHGYPSDYWRMTPEALRVLFPNVRWELTGVSTEGLLRNGPISLQTGAGPYFSRSETVGLGYRV